ncbi:MAG: SEC-C domain-containing protein [Methanosarcinales archaeon]|jgi:hypothetical protein|nr:SEC-C domain-containing protein [Methanosarcinales archaeon]
MNHNYTLICDVCNSKIQLRIQEGMFNKNLIRINCGNCKITLEGEIENGKLNYIHSCKFEETESLEELHDYFIEGSGELLTLKIRKYDIENRPPTPFLRVMEYMPFEEYDKFIKKTMDFLKKMNNEWPKYRRVVELWNIGNIELATQEIGKCFPEHVNLLSERINYPENNKLKMLQEMHLIQLTCFGLLYNNSFYEYVAQTVMNEIVHLSQSNISQTNELIDYFQNEGDLLGQYQKKIFNLLNRFTDLFVYLIPAYGATYYTEEIDYKNLGISTCSFEEIKQFYLDIYETIGELIIVPIALNNIKYRGNFQISKDKDGIEKKIEKLKEDSKGTRLMFLNQNEVFTDLLQLNLNNKLRNAIGHNNYEYNGIRQKITYSPNLKNLNEKYSTYLLKVALECIELLKRLLILDEMVYQLQKFQYIFEGNLSMRYFRNLKIGRNEMCPCGSNLKFKKCHGKIEQE